MRTCPNCGNNTRRISAALNNIVGDIFEARCLCSECLTMWDEFYNDRTGERRNEIIGFYNPDTHEIVRQ